jgi:CheY-like chemotaxis protein
LPIKFARVKSDTPCREQCTFHKEVVIKKVLILDDESDILELWLEKFKRFDLVVEVHTAANGLEGLRLAEAVSHYDLIITDYKMPELNGLEFILKLRTQERFSTTPILFFTGFLPELVHHLGDLENVFLFEKPMISEKINAYIKRCLN